MRLDLHLAYRSGAMMVSNDDLNDFHVEKPEREETGKKKLY